MAPSARSGGPSYELRFAGLFNAGRGFSFPCDAAGRVDMDCLGERARANYFYARSSVGREFFAPVTCSCDRCLTDIEGAPVIAAGGTPLDR